MSSSIHHSISMGIHPSHITEALTLKNTKHTPTHPQYIMNKCLCPFPSITSSRGIQQQPTTRLENIQSTRIWHWLEALVLLRLLFALFASLRVVQNYILWEIVLWQTCFTILLIHVFFFCWCRPSATAQQGSYGWVFRTSV